MYIASGALIVEAAKIGWLALYDKEKPVYKSLYLKAKLRLEVFIASSICLPIFNKLSLNSSLGILFFKQLVILVTPWTSLSLEEFSSITNLVSIFSIIWLFKSSYLLSSFLLFTALYTTPDIKNKFTTDKLIISILLEKISLNPIIKFLTKLFISSPLL